MSQSEECYDVIISEVAETRVFLGGKLTSFAPGTSPYEDFPTSATKICRTNDSPIGTRRNWRSTVRVHTRVKSQ